jgi:hypothetical protein
LDTRPAELKIVANKVEVSFRPDEDGVRHIKPDPAANMGEKVIAALEIRAPDKIAREKRLVKAEAFESYSCLQICLRLFP